MEPRSAADFAFSFFSHNRVAANETLFTLQKKADSKLNSTPIFGKMRQRRIEGKLRGVQERITEYETVEHGLLTKDYTPAITILEREAQHLEQSKSSLDAIKRVSRRQGRQEAIRMRVMAQQLRSSQ